MNLLQIRQQFRILSGRHDLVTGAGVDSGANFFINNGQRHLDRLSTNQKSVATSFKWLEIDGYSVKIPWCRAIKEVWVGSLTARWQVEKKDLQDLLAGYFTTLPSGIDSGGVLYYAPAVTRAAPETYNTPADEMEAFSGYVDIMSGDHFAWNTVLIAPPTDTRLAVQVKGLFYSDQLVEDTDKSYWTEVHSDVLILSAIRSIEMFNRNTQGVNDMDKAISSIITGIDMDLVEEQIAEVTQIED